MNLGLTKNDKKARVLIFSFSAVVFIAVTVLERVTLDVNLGFDPHLLALANAVINSIVSVLLVAGLITAKRGAYKTHKNIMLVAIGLSVIFLVTYIAHHLFAGSTWYGDTDKNGVVDAVEKAVAGTSRTIYFILLSTHILLAGISLPFILFTAYRALINENAAHRKIAKITWPMWFYVAVTGPVVYWMISMYY
jgi:putative membrane protein